MISRGKNYLLAIILTSCVLEGWTATAVRGIRPTVNVSPANARVRKDPKIKASDVDFDVKTARLNKGVAPTLERMANEIAILVNNLYKRRELDEVNVRSLMRIRFYLAPVYQQTKQKKLKARIEEAVREINEELRHRLDFEERYRSGLIKIPAGRSVSTLGTQTDENMMSAVRPVESSRSSSVSSGVGTQDELGGMSPGAVSKLRGAAARARANVAARKAGQGQNPVGGGDRSALPARTQALLNLVESGKIDESQLTAKDRALISTYRNNPSSALPVAQQQAQGSDMMTSSGPVVKGSAQQAQGGAIMSTQQSPDRSKIPARAQALLKLVESGKLDQSQLSPKDRILINEYRSNPSGGVPSSALPPPPVQSSVSRVTPPPPSGSTQQGQGDAVAASLDRANLPARTQALLKLVESGKLNENQLSPKDQALLRPYLATSATEDFSHLPPPPPELLAEPTESPGNFPPQPPLPPPPPLS